MSETAKLFMAQNLLRRRAGFKRYPISVEIRRFPQLLENRPPGANVVGEMASFDSEAASSQTIISGPRPQTQVLHLQIDRLSASSQSLECPFPLAWRSFARNLGILIDWVGHPSTSKKLPSASKDFQLARTPHSRRRNFVLICANPATQNHRCDPASNMFMSS